MKNMSNLENGLIVKHYILQCVRNAYIMYSITKKNNFTKTNEILRF